MKKLLMHIFPSLARPRTVRRGSRFCVVNGLGELISESVCPSGADWVMREIQKPPAMTHQQRQMAFEIRRQEKFKWLEQRCEIGRKRLAAR